MRERQRPSAPIQLCAQLVIAGRTIGGIPHIVFTRPQHLRWPADRLRNQSRFHSVIMLQPPPESATRQRDVHFHLIGIKADSLCHRVTNILRNLRGRPQFAIRSPIMRGAVARLHRRVSHEWKLIRGSNPPSGSLGHISNRVERQPSPTPPSSASRKSAPNSDLYSALHP